MTNVEPLTTTFPAFIPPAAPRPDVTPPVRPAKRRKSRTHLAGLIDKILDRLIFTRPERAGPFADAVVRRDPSFFSPAFALGMFEDDDDDYDDGRYLLAPSMIDEPKFMWPFDFTVATWQPPDKVHPALGDSVQLNRVRSTTPDQWRGKIARVVPTMVEASICFANANQHIGVSAPYGWMNGRWVDLTTDRISYEYIKKREVVDRANKVEQAELDYYDGVIKLVMSAALFRRYVWCVSFGIDDSPRVMLETDATGIKFLFKDRNKEPERDRRAALRHWVSNHWRMSRRDEAATIYVRDHLRGRIPFKWRGFDCFVEPSPYDLEMNERLKIERAAGILAARDFP